MTDIKIYWLARGVALLGVVLCLCVGAVQEAHPLGAIALSFFGGLIALAGVEIEAWRHER